MHSLPLRAINLAGKGKRILLPLDMSNGHAAEEVNWHPWKHVAVSVPTRDRSTSGRACSKTWNLAEVLDLTTWYDNGLGAPLVFCDHEVSCKPKSPTVGPSGVCKPAGSHVLHSCAVRSPVLLFILPVTSLHDKLRFIDIIPAAM